MLPLTYFEDPEKIKKQWEAEAKAQKALYKKQQKKENQQKLLTQNSQAADEDEDMDSDNDEKEKNGGFAKHTQKKHQNMFATGALHHVDYGDEYDEEDEDEESEDEDDQYQENVFNQQNAFGMQVYNTRARAAHGFGGFGN